MDNSVAKSDRIARIAGVWDGDVALSLMQAAPFQIIDKTQFYFKPAMQAAEILLSSLNKIPNTVEDWTSRLSADDKRRRQKAMRRLTWDGAEYTLTYAWRTHQGDEIWLQEQGRRKSGVGDNPTHIEGVIRNVSRRQRAASRNEYLANFDELTQWV